MPNQGDKSVTDRGVEETAFGSTTAFAAEKHRSSGHVPWSDQVRRKCHERSTGGASRPRQANVTARSSSESVDVAITVAPARTLNARPFAYSPISFAVGREPPDEEQRDRQSRTPFTTWTPTSSLITGRPGIDRDDRPDRDQRGDHADEHRAPRAGGAGSPSRSRTSRRSRTRRSPAGSRRRAGSPRAARRRRAPPRSARRTARARFAASAALFTVCSPCTYRVAPVAMMMNIAIRFAKIEPRHDLDALGVQLVGADAASRRRRTGRRAA